MLRNIKTLFIAGIVLVSFLLGSSFISKKESSSPQKLLVQKWKMWKVEEGGSEVEPKFSRFILTLKKNNTFVITSEYEMTHRGEWSYKNKTLTLNDKVTNRPIVLPVKTLDATHLVVNNYEGQDRSTFMTPVTSKDAIHLNHKEHLMAKKWRIFNSTKERNIGAYYEFHEDKTFVYLLPGSTVAASAGKWSLSPDGKIVTLEVKRSKEKFSLAVDELHRHALTLRNTETGTTNFLHDEYLTQKDLDEETSIETPSEKTSE